MPEITPQVVIERHQQRAGRIAQFWSRVTVEIQWEDEKKGRQWEQADGQLIIRKPAELGLGLGKGGDHFFWFGSNADRYWLFDLKSTDVPPTGYIGRHVNIGKPGQRPLPIPVRPSQIISLLGITPLPPATTGQWVLEEGQPWRVKVEMPIIANGAPGKAALLLDSKTGEPAIIRIFNAAGEQTAQASLEKYLRLQISNAGPGGGPTLPGYIKIQVPERKTVITLYIDDEPVDGVEPRKVIDMQFDFEKLYDLLKVQRKIDLDAGIKP